MRFTPEFLDELRARLPVSEVVGKRVKLKKAGREWKGLSPFQQEKTPSFFVNDQKQAWFDFSSGLNGNIFDFLMKTEGVGFPEAVERCAAMAGLALPAATPDAARHEQRRKTLHDIMELVSEIFRGYAGLAARRQSARLSRRPRDLARHATAVPSRLRDRRALRAEGASGRAGRLDRGHGRGGAS